MKSESTLRKEAEDQQFVVDTRFRIGDGINREFTEEEIRKFFSEALGECGRRLTHCAYMAQCWPKETRVKGKPWSFFEENRPG